MQLLRSFGITAIFGISLVAGASLSACGGDSEDDSATPGATDAGADASTATGGDGATDGATVDLSKGPLLPLTIGSRWTYRVTDGDKVTEKTLTAQVQEVVGGVGPHATDTAVKLVADRGDELTYSWVKAEGDVVVRYREQTLDSATKAVKTEDVWDPSRLYVDGSAEHTAMGASWLEEHMETSSNTKKGTTDTTDVRERWTVISASESITVPAGTFDAIVFQKAGATKLKTFWYVPGVGKVKEEGGQTEELSDYDIAK